MDKERFLQSGLLEQYVLGLTTEEESKEVERYARAFPDIQAEIDLLRNAVQQYAEEQIGVPKVSKRQNQHSNGSPYNIGGPAPKAPSGAMLSRWAMAAGMILFAGFGLYYFSQAQNSQAEIAQLSNNYVALKVDCEKDHTLIQELQQQVAFYQHNRTYPVQLEGTSLAPNSEVRVFWNEYEKQAVLQVLSLPDQPESKQYQIWADVDGKMIDLGVIDAHSDQPQAIRCFPQASSLNITLEPTGGSVEPHVDQLYANVNLPLANSK